jgi:large subunit ribosomal protein L18
MSQSVKAKALNARRKERNRIAIRKKAVGRIRLSVFRSGKHIYAQLIDDTKGVTLASASSLDKSLKDKKTSTVDAAKSVGEAIAKKAKDVKVKEVVFDRGGYLFHGRVKALADAAREHGLSF